MIKVVEAFSGIGSQAKALSLLNKENNKKYKYEIIQTIDWDINSIIAYDLIHNGPFDYSNIKNLNKDEITKKLLDHNITINGKTLTTERSLKHYKNEVLKIMLSSIKRTKNLGSIKNINYNDLPNDIDVLTYSFPCQDLSLSGYFHGDNGGINRDANNNSSMLWEIERLLVEFKDNNKPMPKILLMENVTSIRSTKHRDNFNEWIDNLEDMGYISKPFDLCANDFGIPQSRKRTFMISLFHENDIEKEKAIKEFLNNSELFNEKYKSKTKGYLKDYLKLDYTNKTYKKEAKEQIPNKTKSRVGILKNNPVLVDLKGNVVYDSLRTITTKQDRDPNSGVIMISRKVFGIKKDKSKFRYITPREAFSLMGFEEEDFDRIVNNNFMSNRSRFFFTKDKLTKMAGNSIVVNVLVEVFREIYNIYEQIYNKEGDDKDGL